MNRLTLLAVPALLVVVPPAHAAETCDNAQILDHRALLVVVPHPDDEVLGFGGLIGSFRDAHLPVQVVVATDGDAACGACRFWRNAGPEGPACAPEDQQRFATTRREESRAALALLGQSQVSFLGYPDGSLSSAMADLQSTPDAPLPRRRCDPSNQEPLAPTATPRQLVDTLQQWISALPPHALVATASPDASHPDHAALGALVSQLAARSPADPDLIFATIHAPRAGAAGSECSYPAPAAQDCGCTAEAGAFRQQAGRLSAMRARRYEPDEPGSSPRRLATTSLQLCLPPKFYTGSAPLLRRAVDAFGTQIGTSAMDDRPIDPALRGLSDCTGYMLGFVRSTEPFWEPAPSKAARMTTTRAHL